jgi:hypothetical protein
MTQPVSGGWNLVCLDGSNENPLEPIASPAAPPPPPPPPPPAAASIAAARAAALAAGGDRQVQQALDGFFHQMSALTVAVDGQNIVASVPFRMAPPGGASNAVEAGRGTLVQIRVATEKLISGGDPSERPRDGAGLRQFMFLHSIGIDCAGYVRQAAIAAHLLPGDGMITNDDLSGQSLRARGFALLPDCRTARPGDIFVLGPRLDGSEDIGHRAIVYSHGVSPPSEVPPQVAAQLGSPAGAVHVFQVDSSWGASHTAQNGGVRRETWWYGESTGQWAWQPPVPGARSYSVAAGPYGHVFGTSSYGLFRARISR